ncbi:glycosyltransferase [Gloeobacter kilaueensis]|uniref:Group 1 glycosyl transferase n=1 Tax=Gloeobacter kilaueensis (strain ATCC BAA-2537 / CCAP 1431/1 / ULC 316 / JS1) TaxID=1183438 RepID=U5QLF1_GLOK1|nr:glycosyltransferase [Gloeobacter kilaueensis]AGY59718.1 group 1 glycosyl transferase [Gloeobacter kilaueensis JS1]
MKEPLRIHFLVDSTGETGTYFRFHNLAVGLARLGQSVSVFACDHDTNSQTRTIERDGVLYRIVPSFRGQSFFTASNHPLNALARCLADYPPCDIAHLFQPHLSAALAWDWRRTLPARLYFYDWDDLWSDGGLLAKSVPGFRPWWFQTCTRWGERRFPARAHHVTTCSRFLADLAAKRGARAVTVLHNGFWPFDPASKHIARQQLGLQPDALYVGFMGRTWAEIAWCFEAVDQNLDRHPHLRFALCGPPPEVLQLASTGARERTDFLGSLAPERTRLFAAALDLGLLPLEDNLFNRSRFPIKFAEYMAAGAAVLCSEVGECAELAGDFPWVFQAGSTRVDWLAAFQQTVDWIAATSAPPVDRNRCAERFSWQALSSELLTCYRSALSPLPP